MRSILHALSLVAVLPCVLMAQSGGTAGATSAPIVASYSARVRIEGWRWFETPQFDDAYAFVGVTLRGALSQQRARWGWRAELAAPAIVGLPERAVAPPPQGQLGLGAAYHAANDSARAVASLFLKQAFLRFGAPPARGGHSLRLGRFEFAEGAETPASDPSLAALERDRIAQRLIGPFGWSHVGRSFDGVHYAWDGAGTNLTVVAARPTWGAFQADGWGQLDDVTLVYGALTAPVRSGVTPGEWRIFGAWYTDDRELLKTDNRPLAARQQDRAAVQVPTLGAHLVDVASTPLGEFDALLWGALQRGDWGEQEHAAAAAAVEIGLQPRGIPRWRPWVRAGWFVGTGDDDPLDDRHGTFFQMLPTPRPYARTPFFNLMNVEDIFGSLILRPGSRVTLRTDVRRLRLADGADLWYAGGGAFQSNTFGFAGRPSGGERDLARLFDLSLDLRLGPRLTATAYGGLVSGGRVVERIHPTGASARFGYLELEYRR